MQVTDKIEQLKAATSVRWKNTLVKTIHFETLNFGGDIKIKLVGGRKRISVKLDELTPDGNQQPATSNQQPATSNQQPATSNQLTCSFNPDYWYFRHHAESVIQDLLREKATIVGYFPSSKTIHFELKQGSVGYKVWNVSGRYLQANFDGELLISQKDVEAWYNPTSDVDDLNPADFHSNEHYWDTFGRSETESFMRWLMIENQKAGKFEPIKCNHAHTELCIDGLLTDFGDNRYLITRKALRKLAGAGFYKPL